MGPRTIEKKAFGARMRALRLERKLTYSAMAELLDLSVPMILKYERGISFPTTETLRVIVQRLGVSSDSLLGLNVVPIVRPTKKA
jgi:transcriptional regulator with XRE-family HTH domain